MQSMSKVEMKPVHDTLAIALGEHVILRFNHVPMIEGDDEEDERCDTAIHSSENENPLHASDSDLSGQLVPTSRMGVERE
jgi:hypothetical protein